MKLVNLILIAVILSSCDNRKVYLEELSPFPTILITNNNGSIIDRDSVKMTLKSMKKTATYMVKVGGNKTAKKLNAKVVGSPGEIISDINVSNGTIACTFKPLEIGSSLVIYELKDNFNKLAEAKIEIIAFENLPPVASFTIEDKGVISAYEKRINAEKSVDKDAQFGGYIKKYIFSINGKNIETTKNYIDWVFGSTGNYTISVTAIDSDNASNTLSKLVKID